MFSHQKNDLEVKVSRRFKYSFGFLGFSILAIYTHNYLVKNNPKRTREMYVDKLLNDNNDEDKQRVLKSIVRITFNFRESQILLKSNEISFKKQYDTRSFNYSRSKD